MLLYEGKLWKIGEFGKQKAIRNFYQPTNTVGFCKGFLETFYSETRTKGHIHQQYQFDTKNIVVEGYKQ